MPPYCGGEHLCNYQNECRWFIVIYRSHVLAQNCKKCRHVIIFFYFAGLFYSAKKKERKKNVEKCRAQLSIAEGHT